jgi:hypothetical protein
LVAVLAAACAGFASIRAVRVMPAEAVTRTGSTGRIHGFTIDSHTWALVIGTNGAPPGEQPLRSADADADEVDRSLRAAGVPAQQRVLLLDSQATAAAIEAAVNWLDTHSTINDNAVVFYAGHAVWLSAETQAIVTADGARITDSQLAEMLAGLRAHHTWIILAACYGGGFDELRAPGRVVTAAADATHPAFESGTLGHSYLVDSLFHRALHDNAGHTTVQAAFAQARAALRRDHPDRQPVQYDDSTRVITGDR